MRYLKLFLVAMLVGVGMAHAQEVSVPTGSKVVDIVTSAMNLSTGQIATSATKWLSFFMMAQYVITNYKLLLTGAEIESVVAKFAASIVWFCFCWYLMNEGPGFINAVGNQFFTAYAPDIPSPSGIILTIVGTTTAMTLLGAAVGVGSTIMGQAILSVALAIFAIGMFFAIKLFLLQIELGIIVMMAPFNFSFLGLNATKDNGIAPFKALMTLMFRIVLYGIIFAAFSQVGNAMALVAHKYTSVSLDSMKALVTTGADLIEVLVSGLVAYVVLFGLLFKSDAIAANLSSGSTNLGSADVASAAAAGAALGAAVTSGGAALASGKVPPIVSDVLQKLSGGGGGGGARNASDIGSGGVVGTAPAKSTPAMSVASDAPGSAAPVPESVSDAGEMTSTGGLPAPDRPATEPQSAWHGGTPNQLPEVAAAESRKAERDAAREQRRQEKAGGSAATAGIGGTGSEPNRRSFREHMGSLNHHVSQEKATVSASINMHHE